MIELMRQLIFSVTAASLFGAVVLSLVPDGAVKEVLRMGTGLVLIISLVIPLHQYIPGKLTELLPQTEQTQETDTERLFQEAVLEETETEAAQYAEELGQQRDILCTAQVTAEAVGDEVKITDISLTFRAEPDADALAAFRQELCAQLGISDERISIQ